MAVKVNNVTTDAFLSLLSSPELAKSSQEAEQVFGVSVPKSTNTTTPQSSGGFVSNNAGKDVSASVVPQSHRNRKPFDWLSESKTTVSPTALGKPLGYSSKRSEDTNSNFGMGGKTVKMSGKEYTTAPKAAVAGALEATEGMVKSPFAMAAGYYANKDTYESKRESEGSASVLAQREERSREYKEEHQEENDATAKKFADIEQSINLYGDDTKLRKFLERNKKEMQELKDETGSNFTLADAAYTMG